jgi:hypothetical protein
VARKTRIANVSAAPVELVETAGILLAHDRITGEELLTLRLFATQHISMGRYENREQTPNPGGGRSHGTARTAPLCP